MRPLVECIPNFSEGRRDDVIQNIVLAIRRAGAVHVLDVNSDVDHNRTVVTFVGTPDEVEKAAFAGIKSASELIDLEEHEGVHPRLGAADVVPLVPIRDVKMATCIAMAQRLGQRVGDELKIPVYLYERAATRSDRENLASIRNLSFQYEQLKQALQTDPDRTPDFGPATLSHAGATIIGARPALIAFNVFLATQDVEIADQIARAIRTSGGGLMNVKAAGFLVNGQAQISMNLTNYHQTPLQRVVEMIRREALRYGVLIASSELIGLAPQDAFVSVAEWHLQLSNFSADQLLEVRIAKAEAAAAATPIIRDEPPVPADATGAMYTLPALDQASRPSAFVNAVARAKPLPAGGSVSAVVGALAAALVQMVSGLTVNKPRFKDLKAEMEAVLARAEQLRELLLDNAVRDAEAFRALMDVIRLPEADSDRVERLVEKTFASALVPLTVAQQALEALELAAIVVEKGNRNAVSDAMVAVHMAAATAESAALTVRVNLRGFEDHENAATMLEQLDRILTTTRQMRDAVLEKGLQRAGLTTPT